MSIVSKIIDRHVSDTPKVEIRSTIVVQYTTHYDDYGDYHVVEFDEMRDAVRFVRDHAFALRSTEIQRRIIKTGTVTLAGLV